MDHKHRYRSVERQSLQHHNVSQRPVPGGRFRVRIKLPSIRPKWHKQLETNLRILFDKWRVRVGVTLGALLIIVAEVINVIVPYIPQHSYILGSAGGLLLPISQLMADKLHFDTQQQAFTFNAGYTPPASGIATSSGIQMSAVSYADATKGIVATDTVNNIDFSAAPTFELAAGQQQGNRIVYPFLDNNGWVVYSMHSIGIKEDIVLKHSNSDSANFTYQLNLGDKLTAHLQTDGSIGVFGDTLLSGNITTGSTKDAELLQKARQNSAKTNLLFTIPAPIINQLDHRPSPVRAHYVLTQDNLQIVVTGLQHASYPLSIDPSIYVETAEKFMRGNNETNVSFDIADTLIQKGKTTGARINGWSSTNNLSTPVWGQGTAVAGGYIYTAGGAQGLSTTVATYYSAGTNTFTVPSGVTSITVQAWGAGGGGAEGSGGAGVGGDGGGGGYAKAVLTVTPLTGLTVMVGSGGTTVAAADNGGNGGGYSALKNGSTFLIQAGGGGGGGGARGNGTGSGGDGGAGGGANGVSGTAGGGSGGGGLGVRGTTSAGGAGGAAGTGGAAGATGIANAGGDGGGSGAACGTSVSGHTGGAGGTGVGGAGGSAGTCEGGGGGGGGRFGGGGGGSINSNNHGAGGGGGGSDLVTGTSTVETAGSGRTPGNNTDTNNNGAGLGGVGVASTTGATAGADGGIVITYTTGSATPTNTVSWAHFNTTTNAIDSPNPGAGACAGWCTNSVYNLPVALTNLQLVAYNGFLYALGGENSSGTPQNTVYIAKLGANGEPQLWHPTGGTPVYWYQDTNLPAARSRFGAVAYNNHMYILGGITTATSLVSSNTVQYASINPNGVLTAFTSTGMSALTSARYGLSVQQYNGVIYVIGGNTVAPGSAGNTIATVEYAHLNSDGTMNSWVATNSLIAPPSGGTGTAARQVMGGNFGAIWGAYIYVAGGCSTVNNSGYCTTINSDTQLASINADGSLDTWNTIFGLNNDRIGGTLIAWQNGLYRLGGCRAQDPSTGSCTDTIFDVDYGVINQDGDASTVNTSYASGAGTCQGANPYGCNLPPIGTGAGQIGQILNPTAVMNGYLYVIGGCRATSGDPCGSVSNNTAYASISSTGDLTAPTNCVADGNTLVSSWCVDSTRTIGTGIAAAGTAIFGGRIYVVGGFTTGTNIYYTLVNTDGSINTWSSVTLASVGTRTTLTYDYAYARANPSSAGSNPGNLYIFGGCTDGSVGCSNYSNSVYKCNINTSGVPGGCSASGQMQIDHATDPNNGNADCGAGLGAMAGTVYANYIYLIGGLTPNCTDLTTLRYAKFDNNNNIVSADGNGSWIQSTMQTHVGRRRGAAFGYNGYIYVVGGYDGGSGLLDDIEFAKINVSDGSLVDQSGGSNLFNVSSVTLDQSRWGLSVPVSNSYAYVVGGCTNGNAPTCNTAGPDATITTFQIYNNDSGSPAGYSTSAHTYGTNPNRLGVASTVLNGYIYAAGGCTSATSTGDCTSAVSTVSYAPIDANGSIGTWSNTTAGLPLVRTWGKLMTVGGNLYYVGGQDSTATNEQSTVYYAAPSSGNVTTWNTATNALPAARTKFGAAVWDNRMYVIGGLDGSAAVTSTVYVSPQLNSGGNITSAWSTTSSSFNVARFGDMVTAYANNLYIFGGNDGTNYLSDSQYASIGYKAGTISQSGTTVTGSGTAWTNAQVGSVLQYSDGSTATITGWTNGTTITVDTSKTVSAGSIYVIQDGSIGSWTYSTSMPTALSQGDSFASNGYMYIVGGRSASGSCRSITLVAPVSANTTIATGNNPTGVGEWYETNQRYSGSLYGNAAVYYAGKAYVLGGACASTTAPAISSVTTTPTSNTGFNGTNSTTHNVQMPATIASGDLLLVFLSTDDNATVTTPTGWTVLASTSSGSGGVTGSIYAKLAAGTEGGTQVNFVTSTAQLAAAHTYRILAANWYGDSSNTFANSIAVSTGSGATTQNPNPPSLTPSTWDTESALWIAFAAGSTYTSVTSYPTNYTGNQTYSNSNCTTTDCASATTANRALSAATEDPGTFTMNASQASMAFTVAVRPPLAYNGSNEVQQTALLSQPQVAQYSIMFDTDSDVYPNMWLLNGLDNSVGAKWQLRYQSMKNTTSSCLGSAMTTWGQVTNFGNVTLGVPGVYIPKDGSGTNTTCARFFYFLVTIDSSQAFGYPEDISRGPTITDLTLGYTADPSKRLMHGRTFVGGLQQPDDTPCHQTAYAACPLP